MVSFRYEFIIVIPYTFAKIYDIGNCAKELKKKKKEEKTKKEKVITRRDIMKSKLIYTLVIFFLNSQTFVNFFSESRYSCKNWRLRIIAFHFSATTLAHNQ